MRFFFFALATLATAGKAAQAPPAKPAVTSAASPEQLAESGHCHQAVPLLKAALRRASDPEPRKRLGLDGVRCAMALNDLDSAVEFIQGLNKQFPRDPEVLYLSVHVFSDLSLRASQELLVGAPGSYQVHLLNAEALETQGKWDEAAMEYREVLKRETGMPGIHYRLGRLLLSGPRKDASKEEARREFEAELKIDPNNAGAEYVLGELARQNEQYPAAIEHFGRAAKLDAGFADSFIGLGRSLTAAGRAADAIAPLQNAAKLQPDNPATHFFLATAYRRTGRTEEANREFAIHQQTSEKARQLKDQIQAGIAGPQQVLPQQKAEP